MNSIQTAPKTWTETLYSEAGAIRGAEVKVKEQGERLYALIGRRWCRCARLADGKLVEIWVR